jgi:hypothetical protein
VIYDLQNIHPKWVTAKIVILKDLAGKRKGPDGDRGLFFISTSIRTDGKDPLRHGLKI